MLINKGPCSNGGPLIKKNLTMEKAVGNVQSFYFILYQMVMIEMKTVR
jgi:hypothetical protein